MNGGCARRAEPTAVLRLRFDEFQPIAPGVFGIESADIRQIVVFDDRNAAGNQRFPQFIETRDGECRMCLPGGTKILFDAHVQLVLAALKPAAAAGAQCGWFLQLLHAQDRAVKFPCSRLASRRRGDLHVVDGSYAKLHASRIARPKRSRRTEDSRAQIARMHSVR